MEIYHHDHIVSPEQIACFSNRPDETEKEGFSGAAQFSDLGSFDKTASKLNGIPDECQDLAQTRPESEQTTDDDQDIDPSLIQEKETESETENPTLVTESAAFESECNGTDQPKFIKVGGDTIDWFSSLNQIPSPTNNDPAKFVELTDGLKEKLFGIVEEVAVSENIAVKSERDMILERGRRFAAMHKIVKEYKAESKEKFSVKTVVEYIAKRVFGRGMVTIYKAEKLWNKFGKQASSLTNLTAEKLAELARLKDSTREAWLADPEIMTALTNVDEKTVAAMVREQKAKDDVNHGTTQKKPREAVRQAGHYVLKSSIKNTVISGLGKMAVEQLDILADIMGLMDGHAVVIKESLEKIRVQSTETKQAQDEKEPESDNSEN